MENVGEQIHNNNTMYSKWHKALTERIQLLKQI